MFNIARMQQIDNRICLIKERIREDSILPLESAFPWLPEYWWSEDIYAKPFEMVLAYQTKRNPPESLDFKKSWVLSVIKKFYPVPDFLYEETVVSSPGKASVSSSYHTVTIKEKYKLNFESPKIAKYESHPVIIGIRFVNYCYKAELNPSRLVFGFNQAETKCFIVSIPLGLIKKNKIEVLDAEVGTYFRFSTK